MQPSNTLDLTDAGVALVEFASVGSLEGVLDGGGALAPEVVCARGSAEGRRGEGRWVGGRAERN
jgi:hypothetical protein